MMKRKLAVILAATIMVFLPLAAHALGFGNITLHSALNEPLDADIELLSPTEDDLANIKVKLASPDAFTRAGIDRTALLTELRFKVKELDNGQYIVHLTTRIPVREPFLNFLLELEWQNGRMFREYTMLLDPPGMVKKQPTMVEAPAAATQEAVAEPAPVEAPFVEPEPVAAPEPMAALEPAPLPLETVEPETVEPAPAAEIAEPEAVQVEAEPLPVEAAPMAEEIAMPEGEAITAEAPATEAEVFEDDSQLFPTIPLTAYKESASDEGVVAVEPEAEMALETEAQMMAEPAADTTAVAGGELGDLDYGIVRKGDNLWTIAEKLRQNDESVSVYQVMMALLRSNPDAFVNGNVNRLKVGHVLRIDDPTMLVEISAAEAAQEYQSQTAAWEEYRQSVAQTTSEQPIIGSEMAESEPAAAESAGELTLSSPDTSTEELQAGTGVTEEAVSNDIVTLQDELRQVRQDASTMRGRNTELNSKLRELEDELSQMQRSISVKDDELAALQQQLSALKGDVTDQIASETAAPAEPETLAQQAEMPAEEPAEESIAPRDITAETSLAPTEEAEPAATMEEPQQETEVAGMPESMPAEMEEAPTDATTEAQPQPAVPQPPVMTPPPVQQGEEGVLDTAMGALDAVGKTLSGLFGSIAGGSLLIFIALPVLLVLIIVMFIMIRRRKKSGDNYQESILSGEPASEINSLTSAESAEEESSFLSDFAVSGAGAIQTEDSEVDPLTEADVFMAYGRYEAAEERLKEAIEAEPARQELKLKLIELYYSTKNKPAFENAAEDFYASVGDNANEDPAWQKVASMGAELVPGNPIFSGSTAAESMPIEQIEEDLNESSSASLTDSQVMDIGLDTGVFAASDFSPEPAAAPAPEKASEDTDIDSGVMEFSLDTDTENVEAVSDTSSDATAIDSEGPDFSLDIGEDIGTSEDLTDDSLLDFNLDVGAGTEAAADTSATEEVANTMDFSLDAGEAEVSSDSGALDFDLDLGTGAADVGAADLALDEGEAAEAEPSLDFELNASDAGALDIGGDEVGTKLDLAKAYIDMGDPDGAKSILDEVMGEGNDSQKSEAEELLQQIG